jgi:hypothetical protein
MGKKIDELNKEIGEIWHILTYAKGFYEYASYLHNPSSNEELEYLQRSEDFRFISHSLWRMAIVELAKLFSTSESHRFNLAKFINKLGKGEHFGNLGISADTIQAWKDAISEQELQINGVVILRNKIYAHTDADYRNFRTLDISFSDLRQLIDIVEKVIKEIHLNILGSEVDMTSPFFDKGRFNIIKVLAKEKSDRISTLLGSKSHGGS